MTLDPIAPPWLVAVLAALLGAFAVWRIAASPTARLRVWWALRLVAVALLVVVALRPVIPAEPAQRSTVSGGLEVYIAVDTTSSMAAEDWTPGTSGQQPATRLDGVKADIAAIAEGLPGASFSLVTFDAEAVQRVPLTSDATALVSAGDVLTQEITAYSRGSSVDEPVGLLTDILGAAADANPRQQRVLFYLGDGEQTAAVEPGSFEALAPLISGGAVLGYGTDEGGRMREFNGYADPDAQPRYIADYSTGVGGDAVSRIDETRLGTIASQLGVDYLHRDAGTGIDALLAGFDVGDVTVSDGRRGVRTELYWIAGVPLGLIALAELVGLASLVVESRRAAAGPAPARPVPGGAR